jgi:hypothetical protein
MRALGCFGIFSRIARSINWRWKHNRLYRLVPTAANGRRALVALKPDGLRFFSDDGSAPTHHNEFRLTYVLLRNFLNDGYTIDFISDKYLRYRPKQDYDLFVGTRDSFEIFASRLSKRCKKVLLIDTMHWLFNNHASMQRSFAVLESRGVAIERDIQFQRNWAIEACDYALILGNEVTYKSYAHARKPVFELPNLPQSGISAMEDRNFDKWRNHFLWLGSRGLAHKGLGLTLEAFRAMPDRHLTVCGPIDGEPRFVEAYRKELTATPNITAHGWIDVPSADFAELTRRTCAIVFPSCAEAQPGAVINCMHAGLIPIVSRECGFDFGPETGLVLKDDSVETIMNAVRSLSERSSEELATMSRNALSFVRERHSEDNHASVLMDAISRIVERPETIPASGFIRAHHPVAVKGMAVVE